MQQLFRVVHFRPLHLSLFFVLLVSVILFPGCSKDKETEACQTKVILGKLSLLCDGRYEYLTSGGGRILINLKTTQVILSHRDYETFRLEFWGEHLEGDVEVVNFNHENLNGKHIKDRLLPTRTILFPDGTKLTMASTSMGKMVHTISIYDGNESHQFDFASKKVKHGSLDAAKAKQLDDAEADGEAGSFSFDNVGLEFFNSYDEVTPGNKVIKRLLLGTIVRSEATQVNDYFDDPRLGHT